MLLLRYCANPQVGFWLRCVRPDLIAGAAAAYDAAMADCFFRSLHSHGSAHARWAGRRERAFQQATLPIRAGGFGLTSAARLSPVAWVASWAATWAPLLEMVPALAGVDLATSELPSVRAVVSAHAGILTRRDAVAGFFDAIDAEAAVETAAPRARANPPLAFHPAGLPLATSLPTIAGMADPKCIRNSRAQRKLAQVIHLDAWCGLVADVGGLGSAWEVRRELSRLIGVAQPLAGSWLLAIPSAPGFRVRSSLYVLMAQRRLGLPVEPLLASAEPDASLATLLGDDALADQEHTTRHNRVVRAWVCAARAANGAANTFATHEAPHYSPGACPDFVSEYAGQDAGHLLGEVKVYNPILATLPWMRRGASLPFGATEARLRSAILGVAACAAGPQRSLPTTLGCGKNAGSPRQGKYDTAIGAGHTVIPLICEIWGGFAPDAVSYLRELAQARGDRLDLERDSTTWSTRSFTSYYGQRLSVALATGVAIEIQRVAQGAHRPEAGAQGEGARGKRRRDGG